MTSLPIPCRDRRILAPQLKGIMLDILDILPLIDSMCMYGGDECRFEDMMSFMRAASGYQFIFASSVWQLPQRMSENTTASVTVRGVKPVLVGLKEADGAVNRAIGVILRPFQLGTWLLILGVLLLAVGTYGALAWYFANPRSTMNVCRHLMLDFSQSNHDERELMLNKVSVRSLLFAVTAAWVILILFYEIAVVNFVFFQKPASLNEALRDLSPTGLRKYLVTKGDATELLFRAYLDPGGKYATGTPPWQFCSSKEECYDKLLNNSDRGQFFFTYEQSRRFEQRKRGGCSKLTVFEPPSPLPSVPAGMYYSSGFPRSRIVEIDKAILQLSVDNKIQSEINKENPSLDCVADPRSIGPSVVGWLLLPIIVLAMIPILITVVSYFRVSRSRSTSASRTENKSSQGNPLHLKEQWIVADFPFVTSNTHRVRR